MYAQLINNWYSEITWQIERFGEKYEVPDLHLPKALECNAMANALPSYSINPICPSNCWRSRKNAQWIHFEKIINELVDQRRIELNKQQAAAINIKKVLHEDDCETCDDLQFLLYQRAMDVWRRVQTRARKLKDVSQHKFSWVKSTEKNLELAVFPIQEYGQLACETPPLPYVHRFREFHANWE
uniref:Helitron_like_N domain-containing protein n=2 Tax=Bursaphelenchus xylophilus TaxID=6326 RepID=A0A1I7SE27_BURXY